MKRYYRISGLEDKKMGRLKINVDSKVREHSKNDMLNPYDYPDYDKNMRDVDGDYDY